MVPIEFLRKMDKHKESKRNKSRKRGQKHDIGVRKSIRANTSEIYKGSKNLTQEWIYVKEQKQQGN